jgi:hypothetical protein
MTNSPMQCLLAVVAQKLKKRAVIDWSNAKKFWRYNFDFSFLRLALFYLNRKSYRITRYIADTEESKN